MHHVQEEHVDAMLRQKQELSNLTVAVGESWLKDFSTSELLNMFSLGSGAGTPTQA